MCSKGLRTYLPVTAAANKCTHVTLVENRENITRAWYLVNRHSVKQCKDVGLSPRHQWIKGLMD